MQKFKDFIIEAKLEDLKNIEKVPEEHRWLIKRHWEKYGDSPDEVKVRDLGMKHYNDLPNYGKLKKKINWTKGALRDVPIEEIHFSQPSVNVSKLEHFAKHYNPKPEHFSKWEDVGKEGSGYQAPVVHQMHDGKYYTFDHHRLIASHLRGDKTAISHVYTYKEDNKNGIKGYSQIPTKAQYKFKELEES